jgi:hypothetical protein
VERSNSSKEGGTRGNQRRRLPKKFSKVSALVQFLYKSQYIEYFSEFLERHWANNDAPLILISGELAKKK